MADTDKIIRDPIHGFIKLSPWEQEIVDHKVFQRLRRVRQLALTEMVYPAACHNRFEHSLGVMQVATLMFDQLRPLLECPDVTEPKFSKEDLERARVIVRLAALVHDVGHCPFSHAGEEVMPFRSPGGKRYKHEDYSAGLIQYHLAEIIDGHRLNRLAVTAEEIVRFLSKDDDHLPAQILFWRPLVTGQMDADRADYLLRDSLHAGVAYGRYDLDRLIATLRVVRDPETGGLMIGVEKGGIQAVEGLILARYMMFVQVYFHHTRRAYDHHVTKALGYMLEKEYDDAFGQRGAFPPPTSRENLDKYLQWNDSKIWRAIDCDGAGPDGCLIKERRHDRRVHETSPFPQTKDLDRLYEQILPKLQELGAWVDKADSSWYKFEKSADIRIAATDSGVDASPVPLSALSSLVQALQEVTQRRVYVPFDCKEKAKTILGI
jgi:HD superfamily phosphohydrolase